jgi:hypothetical protein
MRAAAFLKSCAYAGLLCGFCLGAGAAARADDLSDALAPISGHTETTTAQTSTNNVLALNTAMFALYGDAGQVFQKNILAQHPIILGLFSGAGGRFILYRPGMPPLEAPSVPVVYQLLKSIGHSTMALAEVVGPYLDNADNQSWRAPMMAFRSRMQSALDGVANTPMQPDWVANNQTILKNNIDFMDQCLAKGVISAAELQAFGHKQAPFLKLDITWAAATQVHHWMGVLGEWKKMLGSDWSKVYAASNTIYVARQNNVLFSVLAQFFSPDAINDRLMLIETVSFTTTTDDMLDSMTRIIADRSVGSLVFGNYHLMDYELMGGDARKAIISENKNRGTQAFLPPVVPFGSHQWPTLVTPGPGPGSLDDLP